MFRPSRLAALARAALMTLALGAVLPSVAEADPGFDRWKQDFRPVALRAGVSANTYDRAMAGLDPDPSVLRNASSQAEFVKPIWSYLDSAVSGGNISQGRAKRAEWAQTLDAIERRYGVDQYVVVAIWGMESSYGAVLRNNGIVKPVVRSLATLAYGDRERGHYGAEQLIAALKILERGDTSLDRMTGSWAGAMGHTQFIPTTYQDHAVDFTGDGRRDIWDTIPDALASTAAYLKASGWEKGKTWGYEVELPRGFDYRLADEETERRLGQWEKLGVTRPGGRGFPRPRDKATLILPAGADGPAFLMLNNFSVIKRYNNATSYALGVGHLADRIRGGGGFAASWPRNDTPLSRSQKTELQTLLNRSGFDTQGIDGKVGPATRAAIRDYQARAGLVADGYASESLLRRLRGG